MEKDTVAKILWKTEPSGATRTQLHELPSATCVQHVGIWCMRVRVCVFCLVLAISCSVLFKYFTGCRVL